MADNTTLPGTGEAVRTIDKAGKKTQVVTLDLGGGGAEALTSGTVPVSGTMALDPATLAALETINVANFPGTQAVSLAAMPALAAGANNVGRVTRSTDVGRTLVTISYTATNAAAADTLLAALSVNRGGTVTTGQSSVGATAGKTLRITGACISLRTTTAATPWGLLLLRMNASGGVVIGSGVVARMGVSGTAAAIGNAGFANPCMDDGLEFSGTQQIGLSFSNNVATNVTDLTLFGYEYTTPS